MTVLIFYHLYTRIVVALIESLYTTKTLMDVDSITRQTYDYATPIPCDNNPRNIIDLDPDTDDQDFYIISPEPKNENLLLCLHLVKSKLQYARNLYSSRRWYTFKCRTRSILEQNSLFNTF